MAFISNVMVSVALDGEISLQLYGAKLDGQLGLVAVNGLQFIPTC